MQKRESSGSTRSTVVFAGSLAVLGVFVGLLLTWPTDRVPTRDPAETSSRDDGAAASNATTHVPPPPITRVAATPIDAPVVAAAAPIDFAAAVAQICILAQQASELADDDEVEGAIAIDKQVRARFSDLLAAFADAGDRSIALLLEMPVPAPDTHTSPEEHVRRTVLQMLLGADLLRRHQLAKSVDDHARSDQLVRSLLDTMPAHALVADVGDGVLSGKPFMRLTHEPQVLQLIRLASEGEFSRAIATRLLATLWDNLQQSGERSAEETSMLALVMLDDTDSSQVVAACRQLLSDDRYRELVFARLRQRRDRQIAEQVAKMAVRELPPQQALRVLRELTSVIDHARGLYLAIGIRDPEALADAYRDHLAQGNQPDVRRELIMGVGMLPGGRGLEMAELALHNDPSIDVRMQALFAMSVHAAPGHAEVAFGTLLDDARVATDPEQLAAVVLALQNLEHGDANVVARLGARLRTLPLAKNSEDLLQQILARCLPTGGVAANGQADADSHR